EGDRFPHLTRLDRVGNGITAEGARRLARVGWLSRLEVLDLAKNPIGDAGVEALAASEAWANVRTLDLCDCSLTGAAGRHLAACPHLGEVRELRIDTLHNESIVGELARSPHLRELRILDVQNYDLSEADADALARASWATGLRSLRLLSTSQGAQRVLL